MPANDIGEPPDPRLFTDFSPYPGKDTDLAVLCDALQERGIQRVVVNYGGCSDSGAIETIECEPALPTELEKWLSDVAETYCPDGYENDDGGYGSLTIYPFDGLAELEHCNRYEDSEAITVPASPLPAELQEPLSTLGVTAVTAHFDGSSDSGMIEQFMAEPEAVTLDAELQGQLESFLLDLLPGGWETSDGGFGDFTVDVATGSVEIDAYWRKMAASEAILTRWQWRR